MQNPEFDRLFSGTLYSLLSWSQLSEFWQRVEPDAGWYIYAMGEACPETPTDGAHVSAFIHRIDELLHKEHHEDYCGIVYADNINEPSLIKIYDPNNLGTSCGSSKRRILPGWVMSRMQPSDMEAPQFVPQNRKRWWQGFMDFIGGHSH